jgi:hypothetical protein
MSRTAHHRVLNTLSTVSLMLARVERRITDPTGRSEIKRLNDHMKSYGIVHQLLSELESIESDQDGVELSSALERWAKIQQSDFVSKNFSVSGAVNDSKTAHTRTLLPTPFVSSVLQLLVEISSTLTGAGLELKIVELTYPNSPGAFLSNSPIEISLTFKGSWTGTLDPEGGFVAALTSAICEKPLMFSTGQGNFSVVTARLKYI